MWNTAKLSEVCEIQPPKKEVKNIVENDSAVSFMGMNSLSIEKMYANPEEIRSLSSVYSGYTYFAENDVLLAKITPCFENGKLGIARGLKNGVGFGSSEFVVFRCKENILPQFLYYFLNQKSFREEGKKNMSGAVGHKRVRKEFISNSLISLPSLAEQQRIVAKLDAAFAEIDTAIEAIEKNSEYANRIFQNTLATVFQLNNPDWEKQTLKSITEKIGSGATPRGGQESYKEEGVSLIRSMNVHDTFFKYENLAKIDDEQASKLSNVTVQDDDVLLNITGASVARCCVIESDVLPARVNQHVSIIRVKKDTVMPKLLAYGLVSKPCKDELLSVGDSGGSTRQAITKKQIEDFIFCYPKSRDVQINIVKKLEAVSSETQKLSVIYKKQISQYISLKSAILAQELQSEAA
tara:strand:- start:38 stop:1261 length:1224 start_codon:yes stop_codon:yes gene_type:complete